MNHEFFDWFIRLRFWFWLTSWKPKEASRNKWFIEMEIDWFNQTLDPSYGPHRAFLYSNTLYSYILNITIFLKTIYSYIFYILMDLTELFYIRTGNAANKKADDSQEWWMNRLDPIYSYIYIYIYICILYILYYIIYIYICILFLCMYILIFLWTSQSFSSYELAMLPMGRKWGNIDD